MVIRAEQPPDVFAIRAVHAAAFESAVEADIVDALRAHARLTLSVVAELHGSVVGHVAFSPVIVTAADGRHHEGVGLAPMAVIPEHQRTGIGGRLIGEGLRRLGEAGHRFCVVLGHATYYPRFDFVRASRYGIRWEHDAPDEAFMIRELAPDGLAGVSGTVAYGPELA